jgi:site-specific DNA recombinase
MTRESAGFTSDIFERKSKKEIKIARRKQTLQRANGAPEKVCHYLRVSGKDSEKGEISIPDQAAQLKKKSDYEKETVVKVFKEPHARSAKDGNRRAFKSMMAEGLRPNPPFTLIRVLTLSRFYRNTSEFDYFERKLKENGVRVESLTQTFSDDSGGQLAKSITKMFDENFSIQTSIHVTRAMRYLASDGYWPGGAVTFGYDLKVATSVGDRPRKRLNINEGEAVTVRLVVDLFLNGDGETGPLGIKKIVSWLNSHGHRTRSGALWGVQAIHRMLSNPCYYGKHLYDCDLERHEIAQIADVTQKELEKRGSLTIIIPVPPIFDNWQQFEKIQQMLAARDPKKGGNPKTDSHNSLLLGGGLARCSCGAGLNLRSGNGNGGYYRYYHCGRFRRSGITGCSGVSIREDYLDSVVLENLQKLILDPSRLNRVLVQFVKRTSEEETARLDAVPRLHEDFKTAERALQGLQRMAKSVPDLAEDPAHVSDVAATLQKLKQARAAYETACASIKDLPKITHAKISAFSERLQLVFKAENRAAVQSLLRALVSEIEVSKEEISVKGRLSDLQETVLANGTDITEGSQNGPNLVHGYVRRWYRRVDLNHRPLVPQTSALTN